MKHPLCVNETAISRVTDALEAVSSWGSMISRGNNRVITSQSSCYMSDRCKGIGAGLPHLSAPVAGDVMPYS